MIETPWWSNLVTAIVTAIVSVLGYRYAITPRAAPSFGISTLFKATFSYLPHILLLFGILADMFTYEGVYSIPTLIGFLSIFANWLLRYFWDGVYSVVGGSVDPIDRVSSRSGRPGVITGSSALPVMAGGDRASAYFSDYDGCTVQGFGRFNSKYAPQTLVITATIFMYYIIDILDNRGWKNATAAIIGGSALFGLQSSLIESCDGDVVGTTPGRLVRSLISLAEGTVFAGISYTVVKAMSPTSLPSSVVSPFPRKSRKDLSPGPNGTYVDSAGNPYIVLPNGQAFPDVSDPDSRKAFADIAGANLGTGSPAIPSSCGATA